jgi:hypothetical protein
MNHPFLIGLAGVDVHDRGATVEWFDQRLCGVGVGTYRPLAVNLIERRLA